MLLEKIDKKERTEIIMKKWNPRIGDLIQRNIKLEQLKDKWWLVEYPS